MANEIGIPEDIRDVVKGATTGMLQFVDSEVVPMEKELGPILTDERKFFDETGRARPEVLDARRDVRMKSAKAGFYGMVAPENVGGSGLGVRIMVFVEEALYRKFGPGRPLIPWAKGFLSQPVLASAQARSVSDSHLPTIGPSEPAITERLNSRHAMSTNKPNVPRTAWPGHLMSTSMPVSGAPNHLPNSRRRNQ